MINDTKKRKKKTTITLHTETAEEKMQINTAVWEMRLQETEQSRTTLWQAIHSLGAANEELQQQKKDVERERVSIMNLMMQKDKENGRLSKKLHEEIRQLKEDSFNGQAKLRKHYDHKVMALEEELERCNNDLQIKQTDLATKHDLWCKGLQLEKELEEFHLEREARRKIEHLAEEAHQEALLADIAREKVDIADLTWEQKEQVLRILFAKLNSSHSQGKRNDKRIILSNNDPKEPHNIARMEAEDIGNTFLTQSASTFHPEDKSTFLPVIKSSHSGS
uniref:basal body-orientation factor 1 n=1 Tax=Myxine glutinosa TaxID=7769 RepID=UPI00358FAF96